MNELAVTVGVILFPGLITCVIADKITVHLPKWEAFKYGIYSFIFGVICYLSIQSLYIFCGTFLCLYDGICKKLWHPIDFSLLDIWSIATTTSKSKIPLGEVLYATIAAPIVALAASSIINYKILNKIAQKIKVSNKFGDENLYSYYLNTKEILWVYVRDFETNQTYMGKVFSWAETDKIQELVLSDVTVYEYDTAKELYQIPSIYLAKATGRFIIEAAADKTGEPENEKNAT